MLPTCCRTVPLAEAEAGGDLPVAEAIDEQLEDLALAARQVATRTSLASLHDGLEGDAVDAALAVGRVADRLRQDVGAGVLAADS